VLGQRSDSLNLTSDGAFPKFVSAADVLRTPTSLATDGQNLYVADPYNRRVLVFTPGPKLIVDTGVRNAASREIFAVGNIVFAGTPTENETIRVRVNYDEKDKDNTQYEYKIPKDGTLAAALNELVVLINTRNGGNKNVIATPLIRPGFVVMLLTARTSGEAGNQVAVAAEVLPAKEGETAKTAVTVSGANLAGGQDAAQIAAGSIVTILGDNFTDETETRSVPLTASFWPRGLANVEVFFDGISAPIQSVSKTQIVAQLPIELRDTSGTNCWVRTVRRDGSITFSVPVGVPVILQNPGIFAEEGVDPRPGIITHYSSAATATISIDGKLVELINARDTEVEAFRSGFFTRLRLRSKKLGPDGNGLPIAVKTNSDAGVILTAFNNELCCANVAGARVTEENPAVPGETIVLLATGLGDILPDSANGIFFTGIGFEGPEFNEPKEFVSSLAGGKTANVLFAGLRPGLIGLYEVHLELNTDLDTNPRTQVTIAQSFQVSNIVTFALKNVKKDAGIQ